MRTIIQNCIPTVKGPRGSTTRSVARAPNNEWPLSALHVLGSRDTLSFNSGGNRQKASLISAYLLKDYWPFICSIQSMINTDALPIWGQQSAAASEPEIAPLSDRALAIAAGNGDMGAFEQLYQRHHRRVYSLCLRMTQNVSEAEDLAQEAFIQLFRKIGSFRGESAFTTWLHRLTVNQVLMHFRKRSVKLERTTEEGDTPVQIVSGTENPNRMPVIDRISLDHALKQLPPGYRSVFVLHDIEGHEHEEIAKILGVAVGTSKSQLHKARMKLRRLLKKQTPETVAA
jgi:RNA polymerase sigma-70 factor (ECF subfamily)